jgi:hypothetical protein
LRKYKGDCSCYVSHCVLLALKSLKITEICIVFCLSDSVTRFSTSVFFFHQTIPSRPLIPALKYFRILLQIRRDINEYVWPHAMRHSAGP